MSDYDSKLENMPPLGKSVEEVEADDTNRVNPPAPEDGGPARETTTTVAPLPIANPSTAGVAGNFTSGGAPIIGPVNATGANLEGDVNEKRTNDDFAENSEA